MEKLSQDVNRIREALGKLKLPVKGAVARWDVEVGTDSTGDKAVWVYVIAHDHHADELTSREDDWDRLREAIRGTVLGVAGTDVITYVRIRALSEVEPLAAAR